MDNTQRKYLLKPLCRLSNVCTYIENERTDARGHKAFHVRKRVGRPSNDVVAQLGYG